jgi:integrase
MAPAPARGRIRLQALGFRRRRQGSYSECRSGTQPFHNPKTPLFLRAWHLAWRNLRETAAKAIENAAIEENRELTSEERKTIALFKALRFHTLRHTFITMMAERGIPPPVTMAMVGHMSATMTRRYTHISNNAAREAVGLLDRPERVRFVWGAFMPTIH